MHENVTVTRAGAEAVDDLRALFLALHRHHRSVTDLPLVADDEAWRARRGTYLAWFAEGRALLFVARAQETPVGYALVVWHEGADDTFPLAPRYAELYTLSVAEERARNRRRWPSARRRGRGARRCGRSAAHDRRDGPQQRRAALLRPAWASCPAKCCSTDSAPRGSIPRARTLLPRVTRVPHAERNL